jgi:hypothetical protein
VNLIASIFCDKEGKALAIATDVMLTKFAICPLHNLRRLAVRIIIIIIIIQILISDDRTKQY